MRDKISSSASASIFFHSRAIRENITTLLAHPPKCPELYRTAVSLHERRPRRALNWNNWGKTEGLRCLSTTENMVPGRELTRRLHQFTAVMAGRLVRRARQSTVTERRNLSVRCMVVACPFMLQSARAKRTTKSTIDTNPARGERHDHDRPQLASAEFSGRPDRSGTRSATLRLPASTWLDNLRIDSAPLRTSMLREHFPESNL